MKSNSTEPEIISQAKLRELWECRRAENRYQTLAGQLREGILEARGRGAVVEGGPFQLDIKETTQRRLTRDFLYRLLGDVAAEALLDRVEPTSTVYVRVERDDAD